MVTLPVAAQASDSRMSAAIMPSMLNFELFIILFSLELFVIQELVKSAGKRLGEDDFHLREREGDVPALELAVELERAEDLLFSRVRRGRPGVGRPPWYWHSAAWIGPPPRAF